MESFSIYYWTVLLYILVDIKKVSTEASAAKVSTEVSTELCTEVSTELCTEVSTELCTEVSTELCTEVSFLWLRSNNVLL